METVCNVSVILRNAKNRILIVIYFRILYILYILPYTLIIYLLKDAIHDNPEFER